MRSGSAQDAGSRTRVRSRSGVYAGQSAARIQPPPRVNDPPKAPAQLLQGRKTHPEKLSYARLANAGAGRTFLMGLPYVPGDKDPQDPIHEWDKTWAFLKPLNDCIPYYPGGTAAVMKELDEGTHDMILTVTCRDIQPA